MGECEYRLLHRRQLGVGLGEMSLLAILHSAGSIRDRGIQCLEERCEARGESSTAGGACPRSWLVRRQLPVCGGRLLRLGKWILFFPRIGSREEPSSGDRRGWRVRCQSQEGQPEGS